MTLERVVGKPRITTLHPAAYDEMSTILGRPDPVSRQVVDAVVDVVAREAKPLEIFSRDQLLEALRLPIKFSPDPPDRCGLYLYFNTLTPTLNPTAINIGAEDLVHLHPSDANDTEMWAGPLPVLLP
jgi:hypothetical protein